MKRYVENCIIKYCTPCSRFLIFILCHTEREGERMKISPRNCIFPIFMQMNHCSILKLYFWCNSLYSSFCTLILGISIWEIKYFPTCCLLFYSRRCLFQIFTLLSFVAYNIMQYIQYMPCSSRAKTHNFVQKQILRLWWENNIFWGTFWLFFYRSCRPLTL